MVVFYTATTLNRVVRKINQTPDAYQFGSRCEARDGSGGAFVSFDSETLLLRRALRFQRHVGKTSPKGWDFGHLTEIFKPR